MIAWGSNSNGQCTVPALPPGLFYTRIAAGEFHTLALRSDGSMVAFGDNSKGECTVPVLFSGTYYGNIAAGSNSTTARVEGSPVLANLCVPGAAGVLACPCANPPGGPDRGCENKDATGGASLSGTGVSALSIPTLCFTTSGENATVGSILLQGTSLGTGVASGHGVRCTNTLLRRLYTKLAVGGSITAPALPTDADIPTRSAALGDTILAGQKRWYQVYYRDTTLLLPGCQLPVNQFNITNAVEVTWVQ